MPTTVDDLATHTFPLPEAESGKLSAVTDELSHQPPLVKFKDFVRANPWPFVLMSLPLGIILGKLSFYIMRDGLWAR